MPDPELERMRLFGPPEIKDAKDYGAKIEAWIFSQLVDDKFTYQGKVYKLTNKKASEGITDPDDIRFLIQQFKDQAIVEGVHAGLPLHFQLISAMATTRFAAGRQQEIREQAQLGLEQTFEQQLDLRRSELAERKFGFTQQQFGITQRQRAAGLAEEQRQFDFLQRRGAQERLFEEERLRQQGILGQQQVVAQRLAARGRQEPRILETEKAQIFESARAELLGALTGPQDWIRRWELSPQNKPNPFQQTSQERKQENIDLVREEVKGLKEAASIIQKRAKDPTDPLFMNVDRLDVPASPEQTYAFGIMSRLHTAESKLLEFTAPSRAEQEAAEITGLDPRKIGGLAVRFASNRGDPEFANLTIEEQKALTSVALEAGFDEAPRAPRPTGPPTPAFLSRLFPQLGPTITPTQDIGRVSGQAFGRLTQSQQQGLLGFAEFQGIEPGEILPQFTQRRPGPRFVPARQRVSV